MNKTLKLMTDYDCFPLWDVNDGLNIVPDSLPLPEEIKLRLERWAKYYDETLSRDDPLSSKFRSEEEELAFENEGKALWQILKEELGADYKVIYFSNLESKILE